MTGLRVMNVEGGNKLNIFAMNADGSHLAQLTHFEAPYEVGDTNCSSDGNKIAFEHDINGSKQSDPNAYAEVWTMNSDGSAQTSTGVQCSGVGCAPRWRPRPQSRVCKHEFEAHQRPPGLNSALDLDACSVPIVRWNDR